MSMFDFLFQGSPPPSVTTAATTVQGFPDWYQELIRANVGQATGVMKEPWRGYQGPRNQDFVPDQQSAFSTIRNMQGSWSGDTNLVDQALTGGLTGGLNQGMLNSFMNPYTNNVVNRIGELGNRNLMENVLPGVNDTFTQAGQFGSSRHGDFTLRALRDNQDAISGRQSEALMGAQDSAFKNYFDWVDDSLNMTQQLSGLAQMKQQLGLRDAAALAEVGGLQQGMYQKNLDTGYADFLEQRNWPRQNVDFMNAVIRGFPAPQYNTTTQQGPANVYQPSPFATAASAATGLYGLNQLAAGGGQQR